MKNYDVLNELVPKTQELHRAIFDKGYEQGQKDILEQEPCEDCISREAIKRKLQEHHDFFIHIYNGFSNMPQNDKSRIDEINNCIAMIVNEPSVIQKEKTGHWIDNTDKIDAQHGIHEYKCSKCGKYAGCFVSGTGVWWDRIKPNFCPNCGAKMIEPQESEDEEATNG